MPSINTFNSIERHYLLCIFFGFFVCYTVSQVLEFKENSAETYRVSLQTVGYIRLWTEDLKYPRVFASQGPNTIAGCFIVSVILLMFIFPTTKCQPLN